jgi:FkbM family methyltransferase
VQHGVTGFRCRTFEQFYWAAKNIDTISPRACREWAEKNYNFNKIGLMYKEYFESIINVSKGSGWYTKNDTRKELEWLTKTQPTQPKTFKEILNQYNRIKDGKVHFLQIGAMDGVKHDDLYSYVMSYDWTGVLVEPLPDMFEKLVENYTLKDGLKFENSAIAEVETVIIYRVPAEKIGTDGIPDWAEGCSTMVPKSHIEDIVPHMVEQEVRGITISKLYEKYGKHFDFIQIDTEGYDFKIFLQFLQNGFSADLLKIEIAHITYTNAVWMRWQLEQYGYQTFIDGYDLIAFRF